MWIDMSAILSFIPPPYSPSGCPSFWPKRRFILRDMSQKTTWRFLLALPWPPRARESLNSAPLFSSVALARIEREGRREKAGEGLNVVVGAEAGMCPLYLCPFVGHDG